MNETGYKIASFLEERRQQIIDEANALKSKYKIRCEQLKDDTKKQTINSKKISVNASVWSSYAERGEQLNGQLQMLNKLREFCGLEQGEDRVWP